MADGPPSLYQGTTFIQSNFRRLSQIYIPQDLSDEVTNGKFEINYPNRPSDIPPVNQA